MKPDPLAKLELRIRALTPHSRRKLVLIGRLQELRHARMRRKRRGRG